MFLFRQKPATQFRYKSMAHGYQNQNIYPPQSGFLAQRFLAES